MKALSNKTDRKVRNNITRLSLATMTSFNPRFGETQQILVIITWLEIDQMPYTPKTKNLHITDQYLKS